MKGAFTLHDNDTTYVIPYANVSFVKITHNGNYRCVVFYIDGHSSVTMDKVSPQDAETIIKRLRNDND